MSDFLWWRDGVIYQIYPRSFMDSDGDGIGDLPGITTKLDYISDLGVDAIWLSPIYPSPDVDFGYDVADYCDIDPKFGGMAAFDRFLKEAHARNIRVIMDLVLNHTSDQHPWFLASKSSRDNPYRDWYIWKSKKEGGRKPNNWQSRFGSSGWEWDPHTEQYYFHMFFKQQPDLNWRNENVFQAVMDSIKFWLDKGVDGFRLDVFNAYYKDLLFRDNPFQLGLTKFDQQKHIHDIDQPEMNLFLNEFRRILDSYPQRYSVGETFIGDFRNAASYVRDDGLHAAFDFTFQNCRFNATSFRKAISQWDDALGEAGWPCYFLNNHDVTRSASRYASQDNDEKLKLLAALLLTVRGTPFLYYGEEIGMRDIPVRRKKDVLDPVGKFFWPFYKGRDGCRSPMQWGNQLNGGFTKGVPWLPIHKNFSTRNVTCQESDPLSLLNFYKKLIKIRKLNPVFSRGDYFPIDQPNTNVLAFKRVLQNQTGLALFNFNQRAESVKLPPTSEPTDMVFLASNRRNELPSIQDRQLTLEGTEALLLLVQD